MKRITIKDIARTLSLSVSTVSRALTGDKNIRTETRDAVIAAAKRLGYRPNPVAKNLKAGHSNTVGVLVPEMVTPYAAKVIGGVQSVLYGRGIKVLIADSDEDSDKERDNLALMEQFMVDGIIISLCDYKRNNDEIRRLAEAGMPIVSYDRMARGLDIPQVTVDDYMKAFFLTEKLILGDRKTVVHLQGPDCVYNSIERFRGYRDAMAKYRLPVTPEMVIRTGLSFADGAEAADRIMRECPSCDAIFGFTDTVAIGAMNRMRELGRSIPEGVAVAGFSGTELSTIVYPQLSTVEPPLELMGRTAAELLLEKINNPSAPNRSVVLNADIIMRGSSQA